MTNKVTYEKKCEDTGLNMCTCQSDWPIKNEIGFEVGSSGLCQFAQESF